MKPIIFNTDMVRAIMEGRKTQTRRLIKPQPKHIQTLRDGRFETSNDGGFDCDVKYIEPLYKPGDVLWVRETWAHPSDAEIAAGASPRMYLYKADKLQPAAWGKWHPSIHMPREAARLFLRVTSVRAERLQDISAEDCIAEGIAVSPLWLSESWNKLHDYIIGEYKTVWNTCYAKDGHGWDVNDWVWVNSFEHMEEADNG